MGKGKKKHKETTIGPSAKGEKQPAGPTGLSAETFQQAPVDIFFMTVSMVFFLLISLFPVRCWDVWWHMAVGKELLTSHHFITKDPFTFTVNGSPWVPHSYLAGILFYLVYQIGSAYGLIILRAVLVLSAFGLLYRILKRAAVPFAFAAPFVLVGALVVHSRFLIRPHLLEYLFILMLIGFLLDRGKRTGFRFFGPPVLLQALWVNVHPSFYLGPAIVLLCLAGEAVTGIFSSLKKTFTEAEAARLKSLLILMLLMVAASFVNPNPGEFIFQPLGGEQRELVTRYTLEWRSPFDPALRYGAFHPYYEIFLALAVISLVLSLLRRRFAAFLLVGAFVYLSLQAHRFRAELVFIALPFLLIELMSAPFAPALARVFSRWKGGGAWARGIFAWLTMSVLILTATDRLTIGGAVSDRHPTKAFDFVRREDIAHRPFHTIGFGSHLLWHLYPERRSFIDGRNFSPMLYKDFHSCQRNVNGFHRVLEKYNIDSFILPVPELSDPGITNLHTALDRFDEWALVHIDAAALIYVKTDGISPGWLDEHAYRIYHPMTFKDKRFPPEKLPGVIGEIKRALEGETRSARLWIDLAIANAVLGDYAAARSAAEEALSIDPDNTAVRTMLRRLESTK